MICLDCGGVFATRAFELVKVALLSEVKFRTFLVLRLGGCDPVLLTANCLEYLLNAGLKELPCSWRRSPVVGALHPAS